MNVMGQIEPATVSLEELLDRARALRPMLAERASQTETDRRVSAEITRIMVESGLYRLGQP